MQSYKTDKHFPVLAIFCAKLNEHVVMDFARDVTSRPHLIEREFAPVEGQGVTASADPDI
ncbi:hypothetical protein N9K95_02600 [Schleiferiaceae bacterium]|nr:hypothetical protein [Schleiferiaceae bacterium]